MFHSVCAQSRLPCSSHTFFAHVGGVHTNGSSHGLFGNSNTSMQNHGSLPLIHTGTMLSAPHFSRCSGVWMTMSFSPARHCAFEMVCLAIALLPWLIFPG